MCLNQEHSYCKLLVPSDMEQTVSAYMLYLQCGHIMCRKQLNPFPHVGVLVKQRFFVLLSCGQ